MQTADRTTELGKKLFYASYILMLVRMLITSSMLCVPFHTDTIFFKHVLRVLFWIPILLKIVTQDRFSSRTFLSYAIFTCVAMLSLVFNRHFILIDLSILIVGVHGVPMKGVVRTFFYTASILCGMLFLLSVLGVIENRVTYTGDRPRYSFGSVYATDFAATLFYIELAHAYLKGKKYSVWNFLFWIAVSFFVLHFCVARLDFALIFCVAWAMLGIAYSPKLFSARATGAILWGFIPIFCIGSIVLHIVYTPGNDFLSWLNELLSGRLYYGNIVISDYGFSLFGKDIKMQGWGFSTLEWDAELGYYFVDCGWLSIILQYGIVMAAFVCAVYTVVSMRSFKAGDSVLPVILFFIALSSVVDHHILEYWFNPFLLVLNAGLHAKQQKSRAKRPAVAAETV